MGCKSSPADKFLNFITRETEGEALLIYSQLTSSRRSFIAMICPQAGSSNLILRGSAGSSRVSLKPYFYVEVTLSGFASSCPFELQ